MKRDDDKPDRGQMAQDKWGWPAGAGRPGHLPPLTGSVPKQQYFFPLRVPFPHLFICKNRSEPGKGDEMYSEAKVGGGGGVLQY